MRPAPTTAPARTGPGATQRGLRASGLTRSFGDLAALRGLDLTVERGAVLGFLGPNGAGKTTAMRCITGILRPDAGDVRFDGAPITPTFRRRIGYMPEQRGLYPKMRLAEQVRYFARLHGRDPASAARAADAWLERLGLADRGGDPVERLSHGNQQRAQLAAALVHEPDLLILDEPFSGLDPVGVDALSGILRAEADRGAAVVFSSHQLDLVEQFCDRVAIISGGRLIADGDVDEVRRRGAPAVLEIGVRTPDGALWTPEVPGAVVVGREPGHVRVELAEGIDPQTVLRAGLAAGRLDHFGMSLPRLSEVFRHAVAAA